MNSKSPQSVAVASRSFGRYPALRQELESKFERVKYNESGRNMSGDELVGFLKGHELAIIGLEVLNDSILDRLPELKVIGKYGVGLDKIDFGSLERHGVRFGWTGGVNKRSVSELALGFMISVLRHIPFQNRELAEGRWTSLTGNLLTGRTVGIVGCGHIGKDLVELLQPFRCRVLAHDLRDYSDFYRRHSVKACGLEELLGEADIVTLHVPYDASTKNIMSAERLALMKRGAVLVNTARGGLVDEAALKARLKNKELRAAALDVFAVEPAQDLELLSLPNFLGTPHIGGGAEEAALAMGRAAIAGLEGALPVKEFLEEAGLA